LNFRNLIVVGGDIGLLLPLEPPDLIPQELDARGSLSLQVAALYQPLDADE
jgi:hypothetical protein